MNKEMPDEIYVQLGENRIGTEICLRKWSEKPFEDGTKYVRADKAVPEGQLIQIARLPEAVEFRRKVAEFSIDRVKNFYGMNKDKPELSLDAVLWIAACEYLKLISAAPQPPTTEETK